MTFEFVNLTDDRVPALRENGFDGYDWLVEYDPACHGPAMGLWRIRLRPAGDAPPAVDAADLPAQPRPAGGRAAGVRWTDRRVRVDPLAVPMLGECPG
jgi:hypothetical protein